MKRNNITPATQTAEGRIHHLELACDAGLFWAPVMLMASCGRLDMVNGVPVPKRRNGKLVYALPGGGEFVP